MIPDPATVARRRHTATMLVRGGLLIWGVFIARGTAGGWEMLVNVFAFGAPWANVVSVLGAPLGEAVLWGATLALSGRLVRWVVPMGARIDVCPNCGYSLKNLESPVCPECGVDLRSGPAAAPVRAAPAPASVAPAQGQRSSAAVGGVGAVQGPVAAPGPRNPGR